MENLDSPEKKDIYTRNKGRIERAKWFEIDIDPSDPTYNAISIDSRNYPSEFIKELPPYGTDFNIVNVRTWKRYRAKMHTQQYYIQSPELYRDNKEILEIGKVIGLAISPENINEIWIDPENGKGNWLDRDKGKIIILSMLAIRSFSEKFSLDLQDKRIRHRFKEIIAESYGILKELNLIKLDKEDIYGREDWIDPLVNLFLINSRNIQKKTHKIFKNGDNMVYFLDVSRDSEIMKSNIISLIKIIVGKEHSGLNRISDFCINISRAKSADFFDLYEHIFSEHIYDNIMKDIITKDVKLSDIRI